MEATPGNGSTGNLPAFFQKYKMLIVIGVAVLVVLGVFGIKYAIKQGIISTANQKEATLNGQFDINKAKLGECIVKIRETAGVAQGATKALDAALTDIVGARYDQSNGPQVASGKAFSLLVENYPDLSGLQKNFDSVMIVITGCRSDYQGYQEKLRSQAANFESWLTGSWKVRTFGKGLPNKTLHATVLDKNGADVTLRGQAALDRMTQLITVHDANTAYQTGELKPEDPFGTQSNK